MTLDEATAQIELWVEHLPVFDLFVAMRTQWRVGMSGPTGLDYGVLPLIMQMQGIRRKDWPTMFSDLQTMERAALDYMHRER